MALNDGVKRLFRAATGGGLGFTRGGAVVVNMGAEVDTGFL